MNGTYGNHVEIQAIAEVYNRRVEIYCYEATPLNIFQGEMALSDATPIRLSYHNGCHFNSVVDTRHPFVPLGTARPQSYRRQAYPSDSSSSGSSTLEEGIVKSVVAQSEQGDIESQVTEAAERESEQKALDDQMLLSVEKESEARCLEDEILRQVMKESAGDAYANTDAQDDMLQFALQQSRIASLTDVFKSIKIPPLANQQQQQQQQQQPPPPPK